MKIQALMIAVALAAGSALAATPDTTAKTEAATEKAPAPAVKKSHKKAAKKKPSATQSMGAGPASPMTDLGAASRQARIDQAYTHWQAARR